MPYGNTLLVVDPAVVINPSIHASLPYDWHRDLKPVSTLTASPLVLTVPAASPARDVNGLIALARASPRRSRAGNEGAQALSFASAGVGTTPHMAGELFKLRIDADMVHVPYKGSGPAMADLVAGRVSMAFSTLTAALPFIRDGRLRALATSGDRRAAVLPDVPTVAEAGVPGFEVKFWTALFVARDTPDPFVARLNAEARRALGHPELRAALERVSEAAAGSTVDEAEAFVAAEHAKWAAVVRDAHVTAAP